MLTRRDVDVSPLEKKPDSTSKRDSLREDLEALAGTQHAVDDELVEAARRVAEAVAADEPQAAAAIGVDLERVKAAFLTVQSVRSSGTGVRVRDGKFSGGIAIGKVEAGHSLEGERSDP
jgi:hypothetical protein